MRAVAVAALVLGIALPASAQRLWLVVGASDRSAAGIAHKAQALARHVSDGLVVQTSDCGDKQNVFAWIAETTASADAAQAALRRIRKVAKQAYVKRCDVRPRTLLALRVSAIDPTIANVPKDAVNWQDEDRISSVQVLPDGRNLIIDRYFTDAANDPLEGRRERVILTDSRDRRLVLEDNCTDPASVGTQHMYIAFECVREQAGDHLLHDVVVFDAMGKKVVEVDRCRQPKWSDERVIVCEAESVRPDGQLELHTKRVALTAHEDAM